MPRGKKGPRKPKTVWQLMMSDEANARRAAYQHMRDGTPSLMKDADGAYTDAARETHTTATGIARKAVSAVFGTFRDRLKRAEWTTVHEDRARPIMAQVAIDTYVKDMLRQGHMVPANVVATAKHAHDVRYNERRTVRANGVAGVPASVIDSVFA